MNIAQIKETSRNQIKGKLGILFICTLAASLPTTILNLIPVIGPIASVFVTPVLTAGMACLYMNVASGQNPDVRMVFSMFPSTLKLVALNILTTLIIGLWTLLFLIPGVMATMSYSMSYFIIVENKELTSLEAMGRSKSMMHGNKMKFFILNLSFLPWLILQSVSGTVGIFSIIMAIAEEGNSMFMGLGLVLILVAVATSFRLVPYIATSYGNFYHNLKNEESLGDNKTEVDF